MRRDVFSALADPTRRGILLSLTREPQNVNALAEQFAMSRQAVSLHIKYLQECDTIVVKREGRERYCHLQSEKLKEASDWLEPFREIWENRYEALDRVLDKLKMEDKNEKDQD